jgi:PASTA domain
MVTTTRWKIAALAAICALMGCIAAILVNSAGASTPVGWPPASPMFCVTRGSNVVEYNWNRASYCPQGTYPLDGRGYVPGYPVPIPATSTAIAGPSPSVSASPTVRTDVTVPDVVGDTTSVATKVLTNDNLKVKDTYQVADPAQTVGDVISQTPQAGTTVLTESTVVLVIAESPASSISAG